MGEQDYIITSAGGNGTVIRLITELQDRRWYAVEGRGLLRQYREQGAEQAGFLDAEGRHFHMSGSEFCGNAARAAILLLSNLTQRDEVDFSMSGCPNRVQGKVLEKIGDRHFRVSCTFDRLPMVISEVKVLRHTKATKVDFKSMVHVMIEAPFPEKDFEQQHRQIVQQLELDSCDAVSVLWVERKSEDLVKIDSVVWVRDVDSFFHDSSCGSGSIAAAKVTGARQIEQATGQIITVNVHGDAITLESEMEIVFGA